MLIADLSAASSSRPSSWLIRASSASCSAEGVHRTAYWNLAPEYPGPVDHLQMMHLLIGKLPLLVVWDHRDPFDGEDEPPADASWPWPAATAIVTDVFGRGWTASALATNVRRVG